MTLPLCTYGYSQRVTEEEELAQSNGRTEALRAISSYIDTSNNISFETIVEEFLNPKENKECDLAQVEVRYKFFEKVLQEISQILQRLPQDILDTVEDMEAFSWGYMKEETRILLEKYLEE